MMYPLLLVCGAVLLFVYIREKIKAYSVKALILKSLVSVLFVISGLISNMCSQEKTSLLHMRASVCLVSGTFCISPACC